jgi:hypothetical protein
VESIRQRLGGRELSTPGAGEIVLIPLPTGEERSGVVLFATAELLDVWLGLGTVRRVPRDQVQPCLETPAHELMVLASDVRVFVGLNEGQRVRCGSREGRLDEGRLLEKCRYGALVERDDGVIVGAGFQRIWPAIDALEFN